MTKQEMLDKVHNLLRYNNRLTKIHRQFAVDANQYDIVAISNDIAGYTAVDIDSDYAQLQEQILIQDRYFDYNYAVIECKHAKLSNYVPSYWGIILVGNQTEITHAASNNKYVKLSSQLEMLTIEELHKILDANGFANQIFSKNLLIENMVSYIDKALLHSSIIEHLYNRAVLDNDPTDIIATKDAMSWEQLLSHCDVNNMTQEQWLSIFETADTVAKDDGSMSSRNSSIEYVRSHFDEMNIVLGSTFIEPYMVDKFINYLYQVTKPKESWKAKRVQFEPYMCHWHVPDKNRFKYIWDCRYYYGDNIDSNIIQETNQLYGNNKCPPLRVIEAMLNNRVVKLTKIDSNNKKRVSDSAGCAYIAECKKKIAAKFAEWIIDQEDILYDIYRNYFAMFTVPTKDSALAHQQLAKPAIELYDYQVDAVSSILSNDNTLLALDVGAGKTAIMITAVMEMRKSGKSNHNLIVVPNSIVGQWKDMFIKMYPNAKLLAIANSQFMQSNRLDIIYQLRHGDYDCIIMAYSCFDNIACSADERMTQLNERLLSAQKKLGKRDMYHKDCLPLINAIKALENQIDTINTAKENSRITDTVDAQSDITFDMLGINTLFVDEAHNYKNLPLATSERCIRGVNIIGSKKCANMLEKVRCVQRHNGNGGVVFATATPLCNSISDAYAMQTYLQNNWLEENSMYTFDAWIRTFSFYEEHAEVSVTGDKYRLVVRHVKYCNLDKLAGLFSLFTVYMKLGSEQLPTFAGYVDNVLSPSAQLMYYMHSLCDRAYNISNNRIPQYADNMLVVSSDGRKASLDMKLVDEQSNTSMKLLKLVDNVVEVYHSGADNAQIIFCDIATPKKGYNVYDEVKQLLLGAGIPAQEIQFVHDYKDVESKQQLFQEVNSGTVRVLMGSTIKLGIGVNVQQRLQAIHHLDVPWRPSDMTQREGRILRKGNMMKEVKIFRYITKGTFDSYNWQLLETKQTFISQFLSNMNCGSYAVDLGEEVLTYSQVKALTMQDNSLLEVAKAEMLLHNAKLVHLSAQQQEQEREDRLMNIKHSVAICNDIISAITGKQITVSSVDVAMLIGWAVEHNIGKWLVFGEQYITVVNNIRKGKLHLCWCSSMDTITMYYAMPLDSCMDTNIQKVNKAISNFNKGKYVKDLLAKISKYQLELKDANNNCSQLEHLSVNVKHCESNLKDALGKIEHGNKLTDVGYRNAIG